MTYHFKKQLHAFTLSEVLITLGIIGVVAAMTMPSLITKIQNARLESQFKHSYSLLNNALQAMKYEHNIDNLYTYYVEPNNHDLNSNTSSFSEDFNKDSILILLPAFLPISIVISSPNIGLRYSANAGIATF